MMSAKIDEKPKHYIAIGASAGGLKPLEQIVSTIETTTASIVICQHLSPHHNSMLCEILARISKMPISVIEENSFLEPGHIYVVPPNRNLTFDEHEVKLQIPPEELTSKPNISQFMSSLSKFHGKSSIGVILSGTGNDGAIGMGAINASGGVCMVQNPESAEYDSMPLAAIDTTHIDHIGTALELAEYINKITQPNNNVSLKQSETEVFQELITHLKGISGIDFNSYRSSTLLRRITRRMNFLKLSSIEEYFELIKQSEAEVSLFLKDVFIHVSYLFREPEAFRLLSEHVTNLVNSHQDNHKNIHTLRLWVPACAMGQEAFTIATMLEELRAFNNNWFDYKIFATDISHKAIAKARTGKYDKSLCGNLPSEFLEKYFEVSGEVLEAKATIREKIVFSVHNLLTDPPFSRLHVISCRNLLIYFKRSLQEEVINMFNNSLNKDGLLLLGQSESLRENTDFKVLDNEYKLYQKTHHTKNGFRYIKQNTKLNFEAKEPSISSEKLEIERITLRSLVEEKKGNAIVIDQYNNHTYLFGDTNFLFRKQQGMVTSNIFERIVPELKAELRAMVYRVRRTQNKASSGNRKLIVESKHLIVKLNVKMFDPSKVDWVLITFSYTNVNADIGTFQLTSANPMLLELEQELSVTRDNLQTVVEELETANEQLQVYNGELQTSNEEYQSTNEELQTVNEELQSTNEELITVNEELNEKNKEQKRLSADLFNIQESLDLPMFLIDKEYRIKRYTKQCSLIAEVSSLRFGDLFFAVSWHQEMPDLKPILEDVMGSHQLREEELMVGSDIFRVRISPYLNHQHVMEGLVVTFYDITSLKLAQKELALERDIAQVTLGSLSEGIIRLNGNNKIEYVNHAAEELLQHRLKELYDCPVEQFIHLYNENTALDIKNVIAECIENQAIYAPKDSFLTCKRRYGEDALVEITVTPTNLSSPCTENSIAITLKDVSERQSHIDNLLWSSKHDSLTGLVNRKELEHRLERVIEHTQKSGIESSLLYMDLDQFKVVNDTCGHMAGDQLLKQIAELIQTNIRSRDTLARLGGDEFSLLLERCSLTKAEAIAKQILEYVQGYSFFWEDKIFKVGISIGLVSINKYTESISSLLSDSDAACYAAKESGRNQVQIHSEHNDLVELQRAQMKVVSDINEALDNNGFRLYLQKIVPVNNEKKLHWEVLIRMFNKEGKFVLPNVFLPSAERFGLINRIDRWVVQEVANTLNKYFEPDEMPELNINVSANTICDDGFLELVEHTLHEKKIPFDKICFELTETAAMSNLVKAKRFIKRMRDCGCKIAIDDFGTGMSSLAYLTDLPVNTVKLDGKFIQTIVNDDINQTIVESVTRVAHKLHMNVVAEAVETEAQKEMLTNLNTDYLQGFYLQRPVPTEEFISIHRELN
ncbi:EAL domain-containing protein [Thalassotalea euphylliae]|uniref:protein-glutamate O-methyltransferase n=1 Tax=Thalassotalea euphylliae TaxID=1655234 RepID=A0A3E0U036_9GAMM|nr:EAL domain-containing protein [Thalassotalea euphylliae]REL29452.1 EAL domain-containing protein [Thalassotalea euphylliae]